MKGKPLDAGEAAFRRRRIPGVCPQRTRDRPGGPDDPGRIRPSGDAGGGGGLPRRRTGRLAAVPETARTRCGPAGASGAGGFRSPGHHALILAYFGQPPPANAYCVGWRKQPQMRKKVAANDGEFYEMHRSVLGDGMP